MHTAQARKVKERAAIVLRRVSCGSRGLRPSETLVCPLKHFCQAHWVGSDCLGMDDCVRIFEKTID